VHRPGRRWIQGALGRRPSRRSVGDLGPRPDCGLRKRRRWTIIGVGYSPRQRIRALRCAGGEVDRGVVRSATRGVAGCVCWEERRFSSSEKVLDTSPTRDAIITHITKSLAKIRRREGSVDSRHSERVVDLDELHLRSIVTHSHITEAAQLWVKLFLH
jgi:hypothetical protein